MTTYHVRVTRENPWWIAEIDGLPPHTVGATDVEHFADLDIEVRDLIAGLTDTDPDDFDLTWQYVINGADVTAKIDRLQVAEDAFAASSLDREAARRAVLDEMAAAGVPQAAIGDVLGLSHQRIYQLLKAS